MEPQEIYCCKEKKTCTGKTKCFGVIAVILAILFLGVIGAIIGANIASTIGILLILSIILIICNCMKRIC